MPVTRSTAGANCFTTVSLSFLHPQAPERRDKSRRKSCDKTCNQRQKHWANSFGSLEATKTQEDTLSVTYCVKAITLRPLPYGQKVQKIQFHANLKASSPSEESMRHMWSKRPLAVFTTRNPNFTGSSDATSKKVFFTIHSVVRFPRLQFKRFGKSSSGSKPGCAGGQQACSKPTSSEIALSSSWMRARLLPKDRIARRSAP